jgi:hypothetical protein
VPVYGIPVGIGVLLRSGGFGWALHLTFPLMSNRYSVLWVKYQNHVCDLSTWGSPSSLTALFAGLCVSLALRLATFASWFFLFPLGCWAFLAVGLLSWLTDPIGVTVSRILEIRAGWVPSLLRGDPVSSHTETSPVCLAEGASCPFAFLPTSSSWLSTFR